MTMPGVEQGNGAGMACQPRCHSNRECLHGCAAGTGFLFIAGARNLERIAQKKAYTGS